MAAVEFHREGRIAHVRLNRPNELNAIDDEAETLLADAWAVINEDDEIWCAILSAAGTRAFSIGADASRGSNGRQTTSFGGGITGVGGPLVTVRKPLIAAVQGYCVGGGFEMAMCADIIIAAENAEFGLPETKVGIIGQCGVVHRAVRQLPYHIAMGLILTGDRMSVTEAKRFGLVNEVVPLEGLKAAAGRWADKVVAASPLANQAAKHAASSRLGHPLDVALSTRFELIERYAASLDNREREAAARENRRPKWTGR